MKRIFITGGTGFFGKSMLDYRKQHPDWEWAKSEWVVLSRSPEKFISANPTLALQSGVSFISGDIRDFVFPSGKFDAIIHAATSAVTTLSDDEMRSVIIDGTKHIVDCAHAVGCSTVLLASSGAVYGPRTSLMHENDECKAVTAYGKGKFEAEQLLIAAGLDVKIARCFAFVGPYLNRKIHFAIGNFIQNCLYGEPIMINGDGTPLRSYLYADDLVEWLFAVLDRGETGRPYNIGSDRVLSIKELAEKVRDVLGANNEIVVREKPGGGVPQMYAPNIKRIQEELGCTIKVSLEDAISRSAL